MAWATYSYLWYLDPWGSSVKMRKDRLYNQLETVSWRLFVGQQLQAGLHPRGDAF